MGIPLGVGEGVMLAVHRHPLAAVLTGGEPENEAEDPVRERMSIERAVREPAVQVHRRGDDGGLRHQERAYHVQERSKHDGYLDFDATPAEARARSSDTQPAAQSLQARP